MKKILLSIFMVTVIVAFSATETDLPKSAWKKIEKEWSKQWPDQEIRKEEIARKKDKAEIEYSLYRLLADDQMKGYMMISKAFGRYDYFDFMVLYNTDLSIKSTSILIYREGWGGEIASKRWLRQFVGLTSSDDISLDRDIQGISGATISCRSATLGVKKLTDALEAMKENGELE